jgi:acetoin utilization deacetylase AcuC-like enzyme
VSFSGHELWFIQEDGDIREFTHCWALNSQNSDMKKQRAKPATKREMTQFHTDEYIDFLARITPSNMNLFIRDQHKCKIYRFQIQLAIILQMLTDNVGDDCPIFDGMFDYCSISAGGSMG